MIYTELTGKAMRIAYAAHSGQLDKAGLPYIHHPLHIAESMPDEISTIVALLHDVVEDTDISFEDLESYGFCNEVISSLKLLTKRSDVEYLEYIKAIKGNPVARLVKIADLRHNSDMTRLGNITNRDLERLEKYKKAIEILK